MGRGNSGLKATDKITRMMGLDGKEIDLSESPLIYGEKDSSMAESVRRALDDFENKRYKNKIEFARFVDANGLIIEEDKGGKGTVNTSVRANRTAYAMTHNHPRSGGVIGGTLSDTDLYDFVKYSNMQIVRATGAEGTYSIAKTSKFDAAGFKNFIAKESAENTAEYKERLKNITAAYKKEQDRYDRKEISYSGVNAAYNKYLSEWTKESNRYLVDWHNRIAAGQKKYGYTYTLERR